MPMPWVFIFFIVYFTFFLYSSFLHLFFFSFHNVSNTPLFFNFYTLSW